MRRNTFPGTAISMPEREQAVSLADCWTQGEPIPEPDEVRRRMAEIRESWTPEERRRRAVSESTWLLFPWLAGIEPRGGRRALRYTARGDY